LKSDDDFVATQRIYALVNGDTLGQFVPGLDVTLAKKQGVLIQLKSNGLPGQKGTFRTNIGAVNPNSTPASVTWRLYDKNNSVVGTPKTFSMPPFSVLTPTSLSGFSDGIPASTDFSDAWASYISDQQIFAYASVIDNGSTDPTFIPMSEDTGVPPTAKTFNVMVQNSSITISPAPNTLKVGDQVIFHITVSGSNHGFVLLDPSRSAIIPGEIFSPGTIVDKTFTVPSQGTYNYFCTNSGCGAHAGMSGSFDVGNPSNEPGPHY
jgi:plastocyanin